MTTPVIRQFMGTIPDKGQAQTAFDTNVDAFLDWQALQFAPDLVAFGTWTNGVADSVLATALAGDLPALTGKAGQFIRANAAEDGGEFVLLKAPTFTLLTSGATATYTTPTDAIAILVEVFGAGGGSGGVDGQGSGTVAQSGGGGAGGYLQKRIADPNATYTYTVGAAGAAGVAGDNDGGAGGTSTFTDGASITLSSGGGGGGAGMTGTSGNAVAQGSLGGTSSGGDLNISGNPSGPRGVIGGENASLSNGGSSMLGASGIAMFSGVGGAGLGYGSGAGGSGSRNVTTNYAGALGAGGLIKITEFY